MSLIHDALKKAQAQEQAPIGSGLQTFQESIGGRKPAMTKRTWMLVVVLVAAAGFVAYQRFAANRPSTPAPVAPAAAPAPLQPSEIEALKNKVITAFKANDLETAWQSIVAATAAAPADAEAWNDLGLIARKRGDFLKAREAYQKALDLRPTYAEAQNNLAVIEIHDGNDVKARELLQKALGTEPAYAEANFNLGLVFDHEGDVKSAANYYRRFLQLSGTFPSDVVEQVRDRIVEIESP